MDNKIKLRILLRNLNVGCKEHLQPTDECKLKIARREALLDAGIDSGYYSCVSCYGRIENCEATYGDLFLASHGYEPDGEE